MKSLPKYRAERQRLLAHLENQKMLIHNDMDGIKASLKPLNVAKHVISEAADSFRDNNFAAQTTRLALSMLPHRIQNPIVGIVAQIAVPMLVRNVPRLLHFANSGENGPSTVANIAHKIPEVRANVLGGLRKAVSSLRKRIKPYSGPITDY